MTPDLDFYNKHLQTIEGTAKVERWRNAATPSCWVKYCQVGIWSKNLLGYLTASPINFGEGSLHLPVRIKSDKCSIDPWELSEDTRNRLTCHQLTQLWVAQNNMQYFFSGISCQREALHLVGLELSEIKGKSRVTVEESNLLICEKSTHCHEIVIHRSIKVPEYESGNRLSNKDCPVASYALAQGIYEDFRSIICDPVEEDNLAFLLKPHYTSA
jgi:hypothetical protein